MNGVRRTGLALLLALGAALACGQEAPPFMHPTDQSGPPAVSRTQRFIFRDFDRRDGATLGRWAEEIAQRLETWTGQSIPFERFDMIRISATAQAQADPGSILMGQGFVNQYLQQKLVVVSPEVVSEEAFLEAFVQALLNRYVLYARKDKDRVAALNGVPDWFTVGIAQNMKPGLRQRNLDFVREQQALNKVPPVERVLGWAALPAGRTSEKAFCGMMLRWWQEEKTDEASWSDTFAQLAGGRTVTADALADDMGVEGGASGLQAAWVAWLEQRTTQLANLGTLDLDRVIEFKRRLEIDFRAYGMQPPAELGWQIQPRDLLDQRYEPWVKVIAPSMVREMSTLMASSPRELADVILKYQLYFQRFMPESGRRSPSDKTLRALLDSAEESLAKLEKDVALRHHFMGRASRPDAASEPVPAPPPPADLDAMRRQFLDQVEQIP